ncbi:MAG: ABC transporter ATP-binding protein [Deltaproteobacteria bacterium]|nr:ABC transporter ATP-binding protein [Deltaproteobacteria bacterium]
MSDVVVSVQDIAKTFSLGLIRLAERLPGSEPGALERALAGVPWGAKLHRQVEAVKGLSFEVRRNEVFGFLGPNGAGKTTTLKMVLGLIFPTRGEATLFGMASTDRRARERLGFLPENPYLYQYLTAVELLDLCGRLSGLDTATRRKRASELIERVGLGHAADRPVRKFSKGMMQRLGLAQALLGEPELLILDEPMTGLDPIGRKEVRDLMLEQKHKGVTLLFSSHILSDVEMLCDRVAIVHQGTMSAYGRLDELLRPEVRQVELEFADASESLRDALAPTALHIALQNTKLSVTIEGERETQSVLAQAQQAGARVISVTPRRETLEDLFVRNALVSGG